MPNPPDTTTDTVRVFVNAEAVDVARGATAIDCIGQWLADEASAVAAGERLITDSRGLPIDPATPAAAGSIYRTIPNRRRGETATPA
jgi:hypothetical protein